MVQPSEPAKAQAVIEALQKQRNQANNDSAILEALLNDARAQIEVLEGKIQNATSQTSTSTTNTSGSVAPVQTTVEEGA